ncbi:MAG: HNH endonuclease family protein, partial [Flavobacteriaceae bacterium]
IHTVSKDFPLNVMYWAVREDGHFEIIDGQQRTVSICQFVNKEFSVVYGDLPQLRKFNSLQDDEQAQILNYTLMVYFCEGEPSEKLNWFKTINIAGEKLTDQELHNAVYSGPWVTDAKRYFSKSGCPAYGLGSAYLTGSPIRQDYLETAIDWLSNGNIEAYMLNHQNDPNANELWMYFNSVITWVQAVFPTYRREMKGIAWGELYNSHKDHPWDSAQLEAQITQLMQDDEVTKKKGIYPYVLTGKEKYLNIRAFTQSQKRSLYEQQQGVCTLCKEHFAIDQMEADHITPWHAGGKTDLDNGQMLCLECNRRKSGG